MEQEKKNTPEQQAPAEAASPSGQDKPESRARLRKEKKQLRKQQRKEKKKLRKQQRKDKKKLRRQQRRELRRQNRQHFSSLPLPEKGRYVAFRLGRAVLSVLLAVFILASVVTIIRVNYLDIAVWLKFGSAVAGQMSQLVSDEVTMEQIYEVAPPDTQHGAVIDASAPIGEDETWAIYVYMVGSDLESSELSQLSDTVHFLTHAEGTSLNDAQKEQRRDDVSDMVNTIFENDLDLPAVMYEKYPGEDPRQVREDEIDQHMVKTIMGELYAASADIAEMKAVALPENVQLVLQPGGSTAWKDPMINPNRTQRFLLDASGMEQVYDGRIRNMADPGTLVDFLKFCEKEYPADHTMVLFWNHGSGAFGYGADQIYQGDCLSLKDMRWAFEQVYTPDEENPPLDIIGFDACLMASLETAYTFHGFADYMVACEEIEPGDGWNYTKWLGALAENPRMNALQLGKAAVDAYVNHYAGEAVNATPSGDLFAMVDLRCADDLYAAYSGFARAALEETLSNPGASAFLGRAANASIRFGAGAADMVNTLDLGLFMDSIHGDLEPDARKVRSILDDMVLYSRSCSNARGATGLTVYYPATINSLGSLIYVTEYVNHICDDPNIQALYYYKAAGCLTEELQQHVLTLGGGELRPMDTRPLAAMDGAAFHLNSNGTFTMAFHQDARALTQEYRFNLMQILEDGDYVLELGYDDYLSINEKGELVCDYDGKWASIDGQLLPTRVVASDGDSLRYCVRIQYNGKDANLLLSYDVKTRENTILGVQLVTDRTEYDLLADRMTIELQPGDRIEPVYTKHNLFMGTQYTTTGKTIVYTEDTKVEDVTVPDGTYMSYVSLVDARGDRHDMKLVSFDIKNGVITNAQLRDSL